MPTPIAHLVRRLRGDLEIHDAAALAGIHVRRWTRWEQGTTTPRLEHLVEAAKALGVDRPLFVEWWKDAAREAW